MTPVKSSRHNGKKKEKKERDHGLFRDTIYPIRTKELQSLLSNLGHLKGGSVLEDFQQGIIES